MRLYLLACVLASALSLDYNPPFEEQALGQRLCFSHALGFDYLEAGFSRVLDEYIQFFNDPALFEYVTKHYARFKQVRAGQKTHPEQNTDIKLIQRAERGALKVHPEVAEGSAVSQKLQMEYPIKFTSKAGDALKVEGTIDFGFGLTLSHPLEGKGADKWHWDIGFAVDDVSTVEFSRCEGSKEACEALKASLARDFKSDVLLFLREEVDLFEQPTSSRIIQGILEYTSLFSRQSYQTVHPVVQDEGILFLYNCKREMASSISSKKVRRNKQEFSFSQNLLDNAYQPHEVTYSTKSILNHEMVKAGLEDNEHIEEWILEQLTTLPEGFIRFTKDPISLAALDPTKISVPRITNDSQSIDSKYTPSVPMDNITIVQTGMIEITDQNSDLTIFPIDLTIKLRAKPRVGHLLKYGPIQEFKLEYDGFDLKIREPQTIDRELQLHEHGRPFSKEEAEEEDDDDFEDDDEEEEEDKNKKKVSNLAMLFSSLIPLVEREGLPMAEQYIKDAILFNYDEMKTFVFAKNMEYFTMPSKQNHEMEFCTGMESSELSYEVDENRLVLSMELMEEQMPSTRFCNSYEVLKIVNQREIRHWDKNSGSVRTIQSTLYEMEDPVVEQFFHHGYLMNRVQGLSLGSQVEFTLTSVNTLTHYFSSFAYFHRLCLKHWPEDEPTFGMDMMKTPMFLQNCPLAFSNHRAPIKATRYNLKEPTTTYFDLDSPEKSKTMREVLDYLSYGTIVLGLIIHFAKIRIPIVALMVIVLAINFGLSIPGYFDVTRRFGVDYHAYLQQAGAVYHGERNYTQISSSQGPCYYPAGQLWHYQPFYWLHLQTPNAERICLMIFALIHSLTICFTVAIAQNYFIKSSAAKKAAPYAQLIAFAMLGNHRDRQVYQTMFNDEIMSLHLLVAIYLIIRNKPLWATLFISLGWSVKAGVMLILPAFLGSIQYSHGTITLIKSMAILIGIQILVAWPFVASGQTTISEYLKFSQLTASGRRGEFYIPEYWDYLAAVQSLSIFWTFIPEKVYLSRYAFAWPLKIFLLIVNIWNFFGKHGCWGQCFDNLLCTFKPGHKHSEITTQAAKRKTIDILLVGYVSGLCLMPGAHDQFQFWFTPLVPILIGMVPIPLELTFWVCQFFYPVRAGADHKFQHLFLLSMMGILLVKPWTESKEAKQKIKKN